MKRIVRRAFVALVLGGPIGTALLGQTFTTLYSFSGTNNMRPLPKGALVQASDGYLYGTTELGGLNCGAAIATTCGTIFKITPGGALTTAYAFCPQGGRCVDGSAPHAGLTLAT